MTRPWYACSACYWLPRFRLFDVVLRNKDPYFPVDVFFFSSFFSPGPFLPPPFPIGPASQTTSHPVFLPPG